MVFTIQGARRRLMILGLTLLVFVIAASLIATVTRFGDIEADLEERARAALLGEGLIVEVDFQGRDATLRGPIGTEEDRRAAVEVVAGVRGVRVVHDELTVLVDPASEPGKTGAAPTGRTSDAALVYGSRTTATEGHRGS